MKTFNKFAAQGDVFFTKLSDDYQIPSNAKRVEPINGKIEVAHSETGHNHVMDCKTTELYSLPDSIMDLLLVVHQPTVLEHLRNFDTHEPIMFESGTYKVRRQREYTPQGWRRVED